MKVLIISDVQTHPQTAGNSQEIYRECNMMKKRGWTVDFLFWGNQHAVDIQKSKDFFGDDHFFICHSVDMEMKNQFRTFFRGQWDRKGFSKYFPIYYSPDEFISCKVKDYALFLHQKNNYDVIWLEYYLQSKIFESFEKNVLKVIHTHDRFEKRNRIFQRKHQVPEFWYLTRRGERKALSRADLIIAIQDKEKKAFEKLTRKANCKCLTIGNFIEERNSPFINNNKFGFFGSINDANVEALNIMENRYLNTIYNENPDCRFIVAGKVGECVCNKEKIDCLGVVDNIEDFYSQVSFVVSPIFSGTGLKIKNIEALSFGKPVITTSQGAMGITDAKGAIIIANSHKEFCAAVSMLLKDKELLKQMSNAAIEYVSKYNQKNVDQLFLIEKLVNDKV